MHAGFWWGNLRKGDHLENTGVDGSIIFKWIFEKWDKGTDSWRTVLKLVMNLWDS
jgi:hypothetical protein